MKRRLRKYASRNVPGSPLLVDVARYVEQVGDFTFLLVCSVYDRDAEFDNHFTVRMVEELVCIVAGDVFCPRSTCHQCM